MLTSLDAAASCSSALSGELDTAAALAALNSAAAYIEALRKGLGAKANVTLSIAEGERVMSWAALCLSCRDHSTRLSTLRLLAAFEEEALLAPGQRVVNSPRRSEADQSSQPKPLLLDHGIKTPDDAAPLEGPSPAIRLLLSVEALPNSPMYERRKSLELRQLAVLLRGLRLPAAHALVSIHACLGFLHIRFSPIWAAATEVLVAASSVLPRTLWSILSRQLQSAIRFRQALRDSSVAAGPGAVGPARPPARATDAQGEDKPAAAEWASFAGDSAATAHFLAETQDRARSLSQLRADRQNSGIVALRITALAVAAIGGRAATEAMSIAGTVVSIANSAAASSFAGALEPATRANAEDDPHAVDAAIEPGFQSCSAASTRFFPAASLEPIAASPSPLLRPSQMWKG
jgi:hypothetical protein